MKIYEKLSNIQNELKAPKGQFNKFGGYKYRSCEDILEAVKPICKKYNTALVLSDEIIVLGEGINQYTTIKDDGNETETNTTTRGQRFYIKATATLIDCEISQDFKDGRIQNTAYAREEESKKGMDGSQITGTASSYARKYALNGLFNIDDTKDADTDEFTKQTQVDTEGDKRISKTQVDALYLLIKDRAVEKDEVIAVLKEKGYEKLADIRNKDYMNIARQFENFVRE